MKFGLNDVFDSLETALDIKKVAFQFVGTLTAIIGFILLLWFGNIAGNPIVYALLAILGVIFLYSIEVTVAGGISRMAYKELTSGEKIGVKDALSFSKSNITSLFLSPIFVVLSAVIILGIEYLIFLIARVPFGQILISLFTIPIILLNVFLVLTLNIGYLLIFGIISVDESGILATLNKIFTIAKKAPLKVIMCLALAVIFGVPVIAIIVALFAVTILYTLTIFGSASGLFTELAAVEVPSLSSTMQTASLIFSVSALAILGFICSYVGVYFKTVFVTIYLKLKEQLK